MAKSKIGLLDGIAKLPDMKTGKKAWYRKLEAQKPDLFNELNDIIDKHLAGDKLIRRKLPTETTLVRWMMPILAEHGFPVAYTTTWDLVRLRKYGHAK